MDGHALMFEYTCQQLAGDFARDAVPRGRTGANQVDGEAHLGKRGAELNAEQASADDRGTTVLPARGRRPAVGAAFVFRFLDRRVQTVRVFERAQTEDVRRIRTGDIERY